MVPRLCTFNGSATMSKMVRRGFIDSYGSWKIIWTCLRNSLRSSWDSTSMTSIISFKSALWTSAWPPVASSSLTRIRPVVVLPHPDSPTSPRLSPDLISKLMPSTA